MGPFHPRKTVYLWFQLTGHWLFEACFQYSQLGITKHMKSSEGLIQEVISRPPVIPKTTRPRQDQNHCCRDKNQDCSPRDQDGLGLEANQDQHHDPPTTTLVKPLAVAMQALVLTPVVNVFVS